MDTDKTTVECTCRQCGGIMEFPAELVGRTVTCPYCHVESVLQHPTQPPPVPRTANPSSGAPPKEAVITTRTSTLGGGCALQGFALVSFVLAGAAFYVAISYPFEDRRNLYGLAVTVILAGLGLWLFFFGSAKARWRECSVCGGKLAHAKVKICPYCNARFAEGK